MERIAKTEGLIAATFTPFAADGSIDTGVVTRYAAHLRSQGVAGVFVNGTTGEGLSLSLAEREALAEAWKAEGRGLKLFVHVGHNAVPDARRLAAHAEGIGADAIAAIAPSFFKPGLDALVDWCATVASWREAPSAELSAMMPPTGFMSLRDGSVALFGQMRLDASVATDGPEDDQVVWMATSRDGLAWGEPRIVASAPEKNLCEPFAMRSPDGREIALILPTPIQAATPPHWMTISNSRDNWQRPRNCSASRWTTMWSSAPKTRPARRSSPYARCVRSCSPLALDAAPLVALGRARLLHPGDLAVGEADDRLFGIRLEFVTSMDAFDIAAKARAAFTMAASLAVGLALPAMPASDKRKRIRLR